MTPPPSGPGGGPGAPHDPDATTPDSRPSSSLHGRFDPGARLGTRYRIVGLLGRGGMGEVYRADDLELNHSVALKFLPERVARNADDLARLRQEVRIARQIAHPNVCRTYDIAEADGQVFVVMEYVDGEDLASVLRRLGRPTTDKAVEIARGICLGLGAAHENGVIHRDLKPANVMIDGRGRVRIMDFGIAGTVEELAGGGAPAGTPEYMAPEQRAEGKASVPSDIYSLGLVLFEIFTGKRASEIPPSKDPLKQGSESAFRPPSSVVADIDPAVERVIMRCLARDPAKRPQSAYAVFGALPGSDPLAAAVAAGETPSPDLLANAGAQGTMKPIWAILCAAVILAALVGRSLLDGPHYARLTKSSRALTARADDILTHVTGVDPPRFSAESFRLPQKTGVASPQYWRRWSPGFLDPPFPEFVATPNKPPQAYPGSASIVLDPEGKLVALHVTPDRSRDSSRAAVGAPDWDFVIRAAGRDPATLVRSMPPSMFRVESDSTAAWAAAAAGAKDTTASDTTLIAASVSGRVTTFDTFVNGRPLGDLAVKAPRILGGFGYWFTISIFYVLSAIGSIVLARRNVRQGRVDLRGTRIALVGTVVLTMLAWAFAQNLGELGLGFAARSLFLGTALGRALISGAIMTLAYLAIEPFLRRLWPQALVAWARLAVGRIRDPIVGRDILVGAAVGALSAYTEVVNHVIGRAAGIVVHPLQPAYVFDSGFGPVALFGTSTMLARTLECLVLSMQTAAIFYTLGVVFRLVFRSTLVAAAGLVILGTLLTDFSTLEPGMFPIFVATGLVSNGLMAVTAIRFGLVAVIVAAFASVALPGFPWTSDFGSWLGPQVMLQWAIALAIIGFAFVTATGGKSIFADVTDVEVKAGQ